MAIISVLLKKPRQKTINGIVIDGWLNESHSRRSTVTRYPVEQTNKGDEDFKSDHITNQPDSVSISGIITNTPLGIISTLGAPASEDRVQNAFRELNLLRTNKELVSVVTELKLYDNMMIEEFTPVKDQNTGQSIRFTMNLVAVVKVTSQSVAIPKNIIGGEETTDQLQAQNNIDQGKTTSDTGSSSNLVGNNSDSILADVVRQLEAL